MHRTEYYNIRTPAFAIAKLKQCQGLNVMGDTMAEIKSIHKRQHGRHSEKKE